MYNILTLLHFSMNISLPVLMAIFPGKPGLDGLLVWS